MSSPLLDSDMDKILPVIHEAGSDSAMLDNTLEFMMMAGMDLPLAVMVAIPEPWSNDKTISRAKRDLYQYYAILMEAWDGPASILFSDGDVVGAVANGSRYLGVTLEETALKGLGQGAEIAVFLPAEGTSAVPDGSALVAGAPHAENAKAFLEFVQSRDVQELVVSQFSRRSVRTDVHDPDSLPPVEELDVIDYDVHWAAGLKEEFTARWLALCGEDRA